jgi:hypothetical protein
VENVYLWRLVDQVNGCSHDFIVKFSTNTESMNRWKTMECGESNRLVESHEVVSPLVQLISPAVDGEAGIGECIIRFAGL